MADRVNVPFLDLKGYDSLIYYRVLLHLASLARESARKFLVLGMRVMLSSEKPSLRNRKETSSEVKTGQSVGFAIMSFIEPTILTFSFYCYYYY
ncbi:hypothetical protein Bca4012_045085 [Brassica carinata]